MTLATLDDPLYDEYDTDVWESGDLMYFELQGITTAFKDGKTSLLLITSENIDATALDHFVAIDENGGEIAGDFEITQISGKDALVFNVAVPKPATFAFALAFAALAAAYMRRRR